MRCGESSYARTILAADHAALENAFMHVEPPAAPSHPADDETIPWYKTLTRYHWFVLMVAALGWLFDTMDQQLFVLARTPALTELLKKNSSDPDISLYGGYATSIFIIGWATGGLIFGMFGDRFGRARTMVITILIYSAFTGLSGPIRSAAPSRRHRGSTRLSMPRYLIGGAKTGLIGRRILQHGHRAANGEEDSSRPTKVSYEE